jgi:hypothetical protein
MNGNAFTIPKNNLHSNNSVFLAQSRICKHVHRDSSRNAHVFFFNIRGALVQMRFFDLDGLNARVFSTGTRGRLTGTIGIRSW